MVTKQRIRGKFRIELRERDHAPAHVHLTGGGYDVQIDLRTLEAIGRWPRGVKEEVLEWIGKNRETLLEDCKRWHP